jgi:hypothetical protein
LRDGIGGRVLRKADATDTARGGGELTGDLGVCPVELLGTQPHISGERFRLSLAGGAFRWGSAAGVGDRQVFSDRESRILRIFDSYRTRRWAAPMSLAPLRAPLPAVAGRLWR